MNKIHHVITADIGGTNGRLAVVRIENGSVFSIVEHRQFTCADYDSFTAMMLDFLSGLNCEKPNAAHIAVAGRTSRKSANITNIGWDIDAGDLEHMTGLKSVTFMNDFAAIAEAVPYLQTEHYETLKSGRAKTTAPISVAGPGTGFGVAMLVPAGDYHQVVSTEGGHIAFAPTTPLERDLWEYLRKSRGHVCVESLLSGRGLARIHEFLVDYAGSGPKGLEPQEISAAAARNDTPSCVRAVQLFLSILGGVAGDLTLGQGAQGGVWIGGGIVPKLLDLISGSDMIQRFSEKGIMSPYLEDVPIHVITDTSVALRGAAANWLHHIHSEIGDTNVSV